jgi:hypothetical protein
MAIALAVALDEVFLHYSPDFNSSGYLYDGFRYSKKTSQKADDVALRDCWRTLRTAKPIR